MVDGRRQFAVRIARAAGVVPAVLSLVEGRGQGRAHLGQSGMRGGQRQHPAGRRFRGHHAERLGEGARHHLRLAAHEQLRQIGAEA